MIDICGAITFSTSNDYLIDNPFKKISYYKTLNFKNSIIKGNNFLMYLLNATRKEYFDNKNLLIIIFGEVFNNNKSNEKGNIILSAEDLYQKYQTRQLEEAKNEALAITKRRGKLPKAKDFKEFFYLFMNATEAEQEGINVKLQTTNEYYEIFKYKNKKHFSTFEDFLEFCGLKK